MKSRVRQELSTENPTVWIGKEGATAKLMNEINSQLEKREVIKGKILRTALKKEKTKDIATEIAKQTDSTLVEVRGHTFMLYKPRRKQVKSIDYKTSKH